MGRRRRGCWVWLGFLFGLPFLLLGIFALALRLLIRRDAAPLDSELAAAGRAGMIVDTEELRTVSFVPPSSNAAPIYLRAIGQYKSLEGTLPKRFRDAVGYAYPPLSTHEKDALLQKGLPLLGPCMDTIAEGSRLPGLSWNRRWEDGESVELREYGPMYFVLEALLARAEYRARHGDPQKGLQDIETCLRVARQLVADPTIIGVDYGLRAEFQALNALQRIAGSGVLSLRLLEEAEASVEVRANPNPRELIGADLALLRTSLHSANLLDQLVINEPVGADVPREEPTMVDPGYWVLRDESYQRAWEAKAVHYSFLYYKLIGTDHPSFAVASAADAKIDTALWNDNSLPNLYCRRYFAALFNVTSATYRAEAMRRLTGQALRLLEIQKTSGRLPSALPLSGDDALDPFDEQPLRYLRAGVKFKIYSVGEDLVDDRGVTREEDRAGKSRTHDLAVTVR